jgi:hypothetical protein
VVLEKSNGFIILRRREKLGSLEGIGIFIPGEDATRKVPGNRLTFLYFLSLNKIY